MVLEGERRAEESHDAVAHHLVHRALVAVHGLHHLFQHGVEETLGVLGVAVRQELGGALEVGEQHRDLLALAFERVLGAEDLFGQVLGCVVDRRLEAGRRGTGCQ